MNLAQEVSSMETELISLRTELDLRKQRESVLDSEVSQLRTALTRAENLRDIYLRRSEAIKTLLDQTGAALVSSIRKFHDSEREEREIDSNVERPKFLASAERTMTTAERAFG